MLTADQLAQRGEIGCSDLPVIVNGSAAQLIEKYREITKLQEPRDFSGDWPVQFGVHMEPMIRRWREDQLGYAFTEVGAVCRCPLPGFEFLTGTLDAYDPQREAVIEIKTAQNFDWALRFYGPQFAGLRACRAAKRAYLLISVMGHEPVEIEIDHYQAFHEEVFTRLAAFKICVDSMTPPAALPPVYPPEKWKSIDLARETPNWKDEMVEQLRLWVDTKDAADVHAQAADAAKALVPPDVGKLRFFDISISRNKRGHLTIQQRDVHERAA